MESEFKQKTEVFDQLFFAVGGNIELVQSTEHRIELRVIKGKPDELVVEVEDGLLRITQKRPKGLRAWLSWNDSQLKVEGTVTVEAIKNIVVSAGGIVRSKSLEIDSLALAVSGSGDMTLDGVTGNSVAIAVNGSGNINVNEAALEDVTSAIRGSGDVAIGSGSSKTSRVSISGSGDYHAEGLATGWSKIKISGSGNAIVHADEELDISIRGSGDVRYKGNAKVSSSVKGSGDIGTL